MKVSCLALIITIHLYNMFPFVLTVWAGIFFWFHPIKTRLQSITSDKFFKQKQVNFEPSCFREWCLLANVTYLTYHTKAQSQISRRVFNHN